MNGKNCCHAQKVGIVNSATGSPGNNLQLISFRCKIPMSKRLLNTSFSAIFDSKKYWTSIGCFESLHNLKWNLLSLKPLGSFVVTCCRTPPLIANSWNYAFTTLCTAKWIPHCSPKIGKPTTAHVQSWTYYISIYQYLWYSQERCDQIQRDHDLQIHFDLWYGWSYHGFLCEIEQESVGKPLKLWKPSTGSA